MLEKNILYTIGEIVERAGLPVFVHIPNHSPNFFIELSSMLDGYAAGKGFIGTYRLEKPYNYNINKLAYYCDWNDLKEAEEQMEMQPYSLPRRYVTKLHDYRDSSLPSYSPGETIIPVKRNGVWVNAVFTGFEKRGENILVFSFYDGEEKFCRLGGDLIGEPVDPDDVEPATLRALDILRGTTSSRQAIFDYLVNERGVKYLIHFTPIANLNSIFENGIAPRIYFNETDDVVVPDSVRYDKHLECSCFSLSYPNYQMLFTKQKQTKSDFAVLAVDIHALLSPAVDKIYLLPVNASYYEVREHISDYDQLQDARNMFADEIVYIGKQYNRQDLDIPDEFTTNPQAEVLIDGIVPASYIKEMHFKNKADMCYAARIVNKIPDDTIIIPDSTLFTRRKDYLYWQKGYF